MKSSLVPLFEILVWNVQQCESMWSGGGERERDLKAKGVIKNYLLGGGRYVDRPGTKGRLPPPRHVEISFGMVM